MTSPNIGFATLSVIPSVKGLKKELEAQLGSPFDKAAADAGRSGSKQLVKQFEKIELVDPSTAFDGLDTAAKRAGSDAADGLVSARSEFAQAGERLSNAAGDGLDFRAAASDAADEIPTAIDAQRGAVASASKRLGGEAGDGLKGGLSDGAGSIGDQLTALFGGVGDELVGVGAEVGRGAGDNIGGGLVEGLAGNASRIAGGFTEAVASIPVPALAAGAAAGVILSKGFTDSLDFGGATAKLRAQLGLTKKEAEDIGDVSLDIFSGNTGTDVAQINDAIVGVRQNVDAFGASSGTALQEVSTKALNTANIFDEDLNGVIRASSQLIRTGLAKDSTEAFDIITVGLQGAVNKSDDFLDTLNEYSIQFEKLGLSGEESLGLISQAVEAGARDSDVAGDALKEFAIRSIDGSKTTVAAYEAIGLGSDEMASKIAAGGDSATAGLQQTLDAVNAIEDPVKRNQAGVALFGTQFEDLGSAFAAFDTRTAVQELGNVEGAADKAAEAFADSAQSSFAVLKRSFDIENQRFWDDVLAPQAALVSTDKDRFENIGSDIWDSIERGFNLGALGAAGTFGELIGRTLNLVGIGAGGIDPEATKLGDEWASTFDKIGDRAQGATGGLEKLAAVEVEVAETAEQADARNQAFGDSIAALGGKAALARADLTGLEAASSAFSQSIEDSTQLDDLLDSTLNLRTAQKGLGEELQNLPKAFGDTDDALSDMTDAQASALDQLGQLGDGVQGYLSTLIESGATSDVVEVKAGKLRDQYLAQFEALGITGAAADQYLQILGLTPEQVNTAITVSGEVEASAKLQLYAQLLGPESIPPEIQTLISAKLRDDDVQGALQVYEDFQQFVTLNPVEQALLVDPTQAQATVLGFPEWADGQPDAVIQVLADTAPADGSVDNFLASLGTKRGDVSVGGNTQPGVDAVGLFQAQTDLKSATIGVGADLTQADKDIANFFARNRTLLGLGVSVSVPGRAGGGPQGAGEIGWVGEKGAELWWPDTAGTVLNQAQLADGLASAPSPGMSGGDTWNIYETTSARDTSETVARKQRQKARR